MREGKDTDYDLTDKYDFIFKFNVNDIDYLTQKVEFDDIEPV